jgi:hypothetical protein
LPGSCEIQGVQGKRSGARTKLSGLDRTVAQEFYPERGVKMKVRTTIKAGSGNFGW